MLAGMESEQLVDVTEQQERGTIHAEEQLHRIACKHHRRPRDDTRRDSQFRSIDGECLGVLIP